MKNLFKYIAVISTVVLFSLGAFVYYASADTVTKGPIGKEDLSLWYSGGTSDTTYTRDTSTGYEITLNKIDYFGIDVLQIYGGGVNRTKATLSTALADVGTTDVVKFYISPGTWTIDDDITFANYSNVILNISPGTTFSISAGKTLTFYSPDNLICSKRQQIKTGGTLAWTVGGTMTPEWWGAKRDNGVTDSTSEIQEAATSMVGLTGAILDMGATDATHFYKITDAIAINAQTKWSIIGPGRGGSQIVQYTDDKAIFDIGASNQYTQYWTISGLTLTWDAQQAATDTDSYAIRFVDYTGSDSGPYCSTIKDLVLTKGFRGIGCATTAGATIAPWQMSVRDILSSTMIGSTIYFKSPVASAMPNNTFENVYVSQETITPTEPGFDLEVQSEGNMLNCAVKGSQGKAVYINACPSFAVKDMHLEGGTLGDTVGNTLVDIVETNLIWEGGSITIDDIDTITNSKIFNFYSASYTDASYNNATIQGVRTKINGVTAGDSYFVESTNTYFDIYLEGNSQESLTDWYEGGSVTETCIRTRIELHSGYAIGLQNITDLTSNGGGYWFDGVNDEITKTDDADLDSTIGDFSILMSINPHDVTRTTDYLINKEAAGVGWGLYVNQDDLYIRIDDGANDTSGIIGTTVLANDVRSHIAVTFDRSGNATAYVDGESEGTVAISTSATTLANAGDLGIGADSATANFFLGEINKVQVFNFALSETEVRALYSGAPVPYKYRIDASEFFTTAIDRTFTGGATHWTNDSISVFNETTDLSLLAMGTGRYCHITFTDIGTALRQGNTYKFNYDYSEAAAGFEFKLVGAATQTLGDAVDGTYQTIEFTADEDYATTDELRIYSKTAFAVWPAGNFDNFSLKRTGCVLDLNQSGIGHNQWQDASGNQLVGTVTGATPINLSVDHQEKYLDLTLTANDSFTLPKGYKITSIIVKETATNALTGGLDCGLSANGVEIVSGMAVGGSATVNCTLVAAGTIGATFTTADDTIYFSDGNDDGNWDGASLEVRVQMQKLTVN